jgi:hypothetical protein
VLEDGDVLRRPCPVAGHGAVAEALEDCVLVRKDVAVGLLARVLGDPFLAASE